MVKILRVVGSMNPDLGGVVEAINQSASSFNNDDYKMDVLCFDHSDDSWLEKNQNYNVITLGGSFTYYGFNKRYLSWLKSNAKNYDVVILDGLWQYLSLGGFILSSLNVPYLVFTHGMLDPYFNNDKLKYIKKLPFWFMVERRILSRANGIVFTCDEEMKLASSSFPFYSGIPRVATLGIKPYKKNKDSLIDTFYQRFPELSNKRFGLFLSRIDRKKGIDILVDAVATASSVPSDFIIAIAGPDSANLKADLERRIAALGINNKIVWLGMLTGDLKWASFDAAEFFILPSHQENFGIVVAESLSRGTPVLISDKVNIWREIERCKAGLVSTDTVNGIIDLLEQWFSMSANEKASMSDNASKCYQSNFSLKCSTNALSKIINEVATFNAS